MELGVEVVGAAEFRGGSRVWDCGGNADQRGVHAGVGILLAAGVCGHGKAWQR
ncbi:hypothetical protein D3C71_1639620 [compost metagenome]